MDALELIKVAEIVRDLDENPSKLKEAQEKLALFGMSGQQWGETAKGVGALALATTGAAALADLYSTAKGAIQKAIGYKGMLDANPDLAQHDAKKVQRVYNTLHRFNPSYAQDPSVAGQFVKDQINMDRVDLNTIQNISAGYKKRDPNVFQQMATPGVMGGIMADAKGQDSAKQQAWMEHLKRLKTEGDYRETMLNNPSKYESPDPNFETSV